MLHSTRGGPRREGVRGGEDRLPCHLFNVTTALLHAPTSQTDHETPYPLTGVDGRGIGALCAHWRCPSGTLHLLLQPRRRPAGLCGQQVNDSTTRLRTGTHVSFTRSEDRCSKERDREQVWADLAPPASTSPAALNSTAFRSERQLLKQFSFNKSKSFISKIPDLDPDLTDRFVRWTPGTLFRIPDRGFW